MLSTEAFPNIFSESFGNVNIRLISSLETLYVPRLLPFSGSLIAMMLACRSMSIHFSLSISPIRAAVSLAICRAMLTFFELPDINWSISLSRGIKGVLLGVLFG